MNFKILDNLHHDGQRYTQGDTVALEEPAAARLLEIGVIEPAPEGAEPSNPGPNTDVETALTGKTDPAADASAAGKAKKK